MDCRTQKNSNNKQNRFSFDNQITQSKHNGCYYKLADAIKHPNHNHRCYKQIHTVKVIAKCHHNWQS